jgi:hypothetical protein
VDPALISGCPAGVVACEAAASASHTPRSATVEDVADDDPIHEWLTQAIAEGAGWIQPALPLVEAAELSLGGDRTSQDMWETIIRTADREGRLALLLSSIEEILQGTKVRNVALKNWAAKIQRETGQQHLTIDRMLLLIVVIRVLALVMPEAQLRLPPETQTVLNTLYATVGLALALTWRMRDNRKR